MRRPGLAAAAATASVLAAAVAAPVLLRPAPPSSAATAVDAVADRTVVTTSPSAPIPRPRVAATASPGAVARAFVATRTDLAPTGDQGLTVAGVADGARGGTVVRLQRTIAGVPVFGGQTVVDFDRAGDIRAAVSENTRATTVATEPAVPARTAAAIARRAAAADTGLPERSLRAGTPTRWVYDPALIDAPGLPIARLVWQVDVTAAERRDVDQLVLVDAGTGAVAFSASRLDRALQRIVCDAQGTDAQVPCTNPVRREGDPAGAEDDATHAYDYAGDTYRFFVDRFGRDSLDGAGMPLVSTVRYCPTGEECPYENAFWDGTQMVYGTGFAAADDVVGHELTHGVTEFTSNLFYFYQSGAINESLSDVFGEFVDLTNGAGTDTAAKRWQMGEDLPASVGVIRDLAHPERFADPDRTSSASYVNADPGSVTWDGGGVHSNSGVGNKFAALLTDGSQAIDGGAFNGRTVSGVGIDKAARIIYGAAQLLTSAADYRQYAAALRQSCATLAGSHTITAADCVQVDAAVVATEMDRAPAKAPIAQAGRCAAGTTATPVWSDGFEAPGGWVLGAGWYRAGDPTGYGMPAPTYATGGTGNLWGDDPATRADVAATLAQSVTIPAGRTYLRFNHAYQFEVTDGKAYDGGRVELRTTGGTWQDLGGLVVDGADYGATLQPGSALAGSAAFTGTSTGYASTRIDVSGYAGQDVQVRFRIASDEGTGDYGWFVDDVEIYRCTGGSPTPTPTVTVTAPGPVRSLAVSPARRTARITWRAPARDGGAAVTRYRVTWRRTTGGPSVTAAAKGPKLKMAGLRAGQRYRVRVSAGNSAGWSPAVTRAFRTKR